MICERCEKPAKSLSNVFNNNEKNSIIICQTDHLRKLEAQVGASQMREVSNSVITKLLLSYDKERREALCDYIRKELGHSIRLDNCQHSLRLV